MGDLHTGSVNCDYALLRSDIQEIAAMENTSVTLMGDQAEWIVPGDKRFSINNIDRQFRANAERLPMVYLDYLEDLFTPIAHMIEVVHDGNHESTMRPYMSPSAELCARLRRIVSQRFSPELAMTKLRHAPGEAYTKYTWKWNGKHSDIRTIMSNTAHGWQAGRTNGAKHNEMNRVFEWITADLVFRGHSHELFAEYGPPRMTPNPQMTRLVESVPVCGHTGSYLKTIEVTDAPGYSEVAGYRPLPRGYVRIDLTLGDRGISKAIHIK